MNIDNYIESQYRDLEESGLLNPEFLNLYEDVQDEKLKVIFASLHKQYVTLFKSMNERLPTGDYQAHFWAHSSRELLSVIEMTMGLYRSLKNSQNEFELDEYYLNLLVKCQSFLKTSGGSTIPENMEKVHIYYQIQIFKSVLAEKIVRKDLVYHPSLKVIGEGSYAVIFKFKDEYYNKSFALKRAKRDLSEKELQRFKREFEEMKSLHSPYILEVYAFDEHRQQYTMEYMDYSLDSYIQKYNGSMSNEVRKSIGYQTLKAFNYLHSKKLIHRDISPKNILLKKYEDVLVTKISDFGLVKTPDSKLTSVNTEFKGYFNDPALVTDGFDSYNILHETYALTKLLFYIVSGKTNVADISEPKLKSFVQKGLHPEKSKRYQNIEEISDAFKIYCNSVLL